MSNKKYFCIIKNGTVINRIVALSVEYIDYKLPYDLIVEDIDKNVIIGSLYDSQTGIFTTVGNPLDEE
jgi:hypothetical protein